uniref:ribonuclease H n=1 Tax=Seriola dumerili TaxID=41447 RepID=A0A3B4VNR6_SERDU
MQVHVSNTPVQLPKFNLKVAGKQIPFLIDTGATISCLRRRDLNCPLSTESVQSVGIGGVPQREPLSQPLTVEADEVCLQHVFVLSSTVPISLMGRDSLSKLNAILFVSPHGLLLLNKIKMISFGRMKTLHMFLLKRYRMVSSHKYTSDNTEVLLKQPSVLASVPSMLWAQHANHVGLLDVEPYQAKMNSAKYPVSVKQYPLSKEKEEGIQPVIESLLKQGVIVKWTKNSKWYTGVDLCSAYYSIPVHENTQDLFAFTYCNRQYGFTGLSVGYVDSPTVYAAAAQAHLSKLVLPGSSALLQYVDDILVASPTQENCIKDSCLADSSGHRWTKHHVPSSSFVRTLSIIWDMF